jgi:SAM-dependent methyltransferase
VTGTGASSAAVTAEKGRFLAAVLEHYGVDDARAIEENPLLRMWVQYALDTVKRGEHAVHTVGEVRSITGTRCLDVGCAYGGVSVAFARAGASHVVGIDVDDGLLACARALVSDEHVPGCHFEKVDLLDVDAMAALGEFDVVVCYDVLEHVEQPAQAMRHLASTLRAGAVLNAEIPNRLCPSNVLSDPHYQLFGFSTLPWDLADAYHEVALGSARRCDVRYMTGAAYRRFFERAGLTPRIVNELPVDLDAALESTYRTFATCCRDRELRTAHLPAQLRHAIDLRVTKLFRHYRSRLEVYRALRREGHPSAPPMGRDLYVQFGIPTWQWIAAKPGAGHAATDAPSASPPTVAVDGGRASTNSMCAAASWVVRHTPRRLLPALERIRNRARRVRDAWRVLRGH